MASKPLTRLAQRDVQKISSGCNITSTCATVKEMLENSIDAGAKIIAIRLTNTGLKKILVQDNGCGIADEALTLLGRRHYTSKIRYYDDLSALQTYGFRGEAINSLCQFADVTVQTRQRDSKEGRVVTFDRTGTIRTWSTSPYCPVGTFVTVENLFQNVPVRYQEACKPGRQKQQYLGLVHMCLAYSIIHPELKISLYNDESCSREVQKSSRCTNLVGSVNGVLGAVAQSLVHLQGADEAHGVRMDLFAPDPKADYATVSRSSTDRVFLFCNRRPFDSKKVLKAIRNALGNVLPESRNRYPVVVLAIDVPPEQLDVNCTPDKRTMCFTEEEVVLNCLNRLLLSLYVPNGDARVATAGPTPTPSPTSRTSGEDMSKAMAEEVDPVDPGPDSTLNVTLLMP
uniref:DNA mismatch repair protein S5 domain-containing protein n=1 Tax=Eutreptiella gymnastica TaxID=73025 RepID=A0A7S1NPX4_9EUGL|mmetsp:Transcript_62979/g.112350  ORF Transcript_62979/g.112350 Transcript_62979/m.112350 type:complete len:399 (+) Transcript_62979:57-1253(+)